ncbi:hypothetical protein EV426DRAFT_619566 [Tirmania nivea]|nr:hypothetical protein EV426DRAFT_619566 [Tirmania nivea]
MDNIDSSSMDMSGIFDDDQETISDLSQLSSSQFTNFDLEPSTIPSSQQSPNAFNTGSDDDGSCMRSTLRRSWIWQYGEAVTINNKRFWQCRLYRPRQAKRYADGSTKHLIQYLQGHRMTENGPAFGNSTPKIQFNSDVFKQLLVQWMVLSNISFRQVEESSFRLLLSYLASVSASYTAIPRCLPHSGNTF